MFHEGVWGEYKYSPTHSPRHTMNVSDHLHTQVASTLVLIEYDAGWERNWCYLSADFK